MRKTTKAEYNRFKKSLSDWCSKLNMGCWDVTCTHVCGPHDVYASVSCDVTTMQAYATFNKELGNMDYDPDFPETVGKHEAMHILLAEYSDLARDRFVSFKEIERQEEKVVLALERAL